MNNVSMALKSAGVKLPPLNKRVWLWCKDHPSKTSRDVAVALHQTHSSVSSIMGQMVKRGMMTDYMDTKPGSAARVTRYSTVGDEFELKKVPKKRVKQAAAAPVAEAPLVKVSLLDSLSVREAFALYQELRTMFGVAGQ